jgi:hypothetical protein
MTQLEDILDQFPSKPWDWARLSSNPAISFDFILSHPSLPWNMHSVSMNVSISESDIYDHPQYAWDFDGLCFNKNISYSFYQKHMIDPVEVLHVNWAALSANPAITTLDIIENDHQPWNDRYLSDNPNLMSTFILNEGRNRKWHVPSISANSGIQERDILKSSLSSLFEWDYRGLSANVNLPIVYVVYNIDHDWNFNSISINANLHDIERFHIINWDANGLSINKNISFDYVLSKSNIQWDVKGLLTNAAIDVDTITNNVNWFKDQLDPNERIETFMSSNNSITASWIKQHADFIDWGRLSNNHLF